MRLSHGQNMVRTENGELYLSVSDPATFPVNLVFCTDYKVAEP